MKNVLYIGNALSKNGKTSTTIDTLSEHLKEIYLVKIASKKSNKFLRLLDMIKLVLVNKSKTDIVLIDTYSTFNFYYALIISQLCRFLNLKYIPILHGGNIENRLKYSSRLSHLIFNNAYKLVAPSNFLKTIFKNYDYKDVIYIPNSIEIDKYEFKKRDIDTIKLLWLRSFSSIYNPEQAILVLEQLQKMGYNTELIMIGPDVDGSMIKVKDLAKQKNLNVKFTGKLSKPDWIKLSIDCNVFINTTNIDNTPVSVIEAMALGLPVVSTNVGGMSFLISDGSEGLLVPPKNIDAMVNAIIKLKTDETLRVELVDNARSKVENFAWKAVKPIWKSLLP